MTERPPEDKRPLPEGWIRQFDTNNNAWFYVDTRANPPRSIWVHPLDDPEYQRTHKGGKDDAPPYPGYLAPPGPPPHRGSQSHPNLGQQEGGSGGKPTEKEKRGAFAKLKDKLVGTKEEREAERRAEMLRREQDRLRREQLLRERQQRIRQSAPAGYYVQQGPGGYYQQGPGPYGYPQQGPFVQQQQQQSRFGGGGMGMGLPILGGLAGGLLLGSALDAGDGGFDGGDGGFDGGGDFGGGDFGGGDF